jgi:hypothetical protein
MHNWPSVNARKASHIAQRLESKRKSLGLNPTDSAEAAGYENLNKGRRRLKHLENADSQRADKRVLNRFLESLEIDRQVLDTELNSIEQTTFERRRQSTVLAIALYEKRKELKLSYPDIIAQIDTDDFIHPKQIERVETRFPPLRRLIPLSDALDVSSNELEALLEDEYQTYNQYLESPTISKMIRRPAAGCIDTEDVTHLNTSEIIQRAEKKAADLPDAGRPIVVASLNDHRKVKVTPDADRWEATWEPATYLA